MNYWHNDQSSRTAEAMSTLPPKEGRPRKRLRAARGSPAFRPTHKDEFGDPVEIIDPPMWLAGMICVRREDGYEYYVSRLTKMPENDQALR